MQYSELDLTDRLNCSHLRDNQLAKGQLSIADHTPEIAMPVLANASMWALNAMAIRVRQSCEGPYLFCVVPTTRRVIFVAWMVWSTFSSLPTSPPYNVCVNPEEVISLNTSLKVNFFRLIS